MTGTEFATLIRFYTNTNSTTLPNSSIVTLAQAVKDHILAEKISGTKEGTFEVPATRDLPAYSASTPPREFDLPEDMMDAMARVEVQFDSAGDYIRLDEISQQQYPESEQESIIVSNFANIQGKAFYDKRRSSIFLYSAAWDALVSAGVKIWYNVFPQPITATNLGESSDLSIAATTTSVAIPRMFHELWARGVSKMWKETRDKPLPLSMIEQNFDKDLEEKVSQFRSSNDDLSVNASLPDDSRLQR